MNQEINLIIADDHPIFRKGLKDIMKYEPKINILGEANNGLEAIELIERTKPDIAILDIEMPGKTGLEVAQYMHDQGLLVKIIILTMYKEQRTFQEALKYGIRGYLLKENAIDEVIRSVKRVADNHMYISPLLSEFLVNQPQSNAKAPFVEVLTKQEITILKLISKQKTSREIAEELFISIRTVENHRSNICKKLDLKGANSLLKFAIEHKDDLSALSQL